MRLTARYVGESLGIEALVSGNVADGEPLEDHKKVSKIVWQINSYIVAWQISKVKS